ncbi:12859_t:CDS:2 [Funneliformis geosporum]|uniref:4937_t:CDS:1 n=1 Tax=Funneliformis geosporum TaxID=1117311 RepID=A0A9W4SJB7_9GLOM|nr:4937_t:CDS:2 [Funneliformis geosporum]CAI2178196.1 12859_t:CDS:2 [Funneliformis geosporum]
MSFEHFSALSRDFSKLLKEAYNHDVIIYVGKEPNIKTFKAHSGILRIRSPYFNTALSCQWVKKEGDSIVFNKPNFSASVFSDILEYIYTGTMALLEKSGKQCLEILVAADELLMNELHDLMQSHLLVKHKLWLRESFALVYSTAVKLEASKELQDFCHNILYSEPDVLLKAEDFTTIDQDTLAIVLEQRNFQMKEIQIWDHIIQWCMSKHPNASNDLTKWTTNEFGEFEETLRQWIQFVRFCEIDSKEFYQRVRPFKSCFSQSLYEDLECFYYTGIQKESLTYLSNNAIRSSLITQDQISMIANWIDGGQKHGDLWCVENLCEDELCSSETNSYRQGICDAILKSMMGNVSSSKKSRNLTSFDSRASFSTTRNSFGLGSDFNINNNTSSLIRFSVDEYEVFRISKTDIVDATIDSKKFRRGKKRLTLVEKYHTPTFDNEEN